MIETITGKEVIEEVTRIKIASITAAITSSLRNANIVIQILNIEVLPAVDTIESWIDKLT